MVLKKNSNLNQSNIKSSGNFYKISFLSPSFFPIKFLSIEKKSSFYICDIICHKDIYTIKLLSFNLNVYNESV